MTGSPRDRSLGRLVTRRRFLVGAVAATACTMSVPPATAPPTTPSAPNGRASLRVGVVVSLSGRYSREGQLLRAGYETWRAAANERGGVLAGGDRRPVELLIRDDESAPLTAVRHVEQLVQTEGIGVLLGPVSSPIALACATAAERLGALTIVPDASAQAVYSRGLQLLISVLPTEDRYFDGIAELAAGVVPRARPIGLLISDDPLLNAAAEGMRTRADALGIEQVLIERFAADERDITRQVGRLTQGRPRCVVVAGDRELVSGFAPTFDELGLSPPMRALVSIAGNGHGGPTDREGTLSTSWWSPALESSGPVLGSASDFVARFRAQHGYHPPSYAAAAAAAGLAFQLGAERAGSIEPKLVRASLGRLDVRTFWGRMAWDAAGRGRGTPPITQVQGGHVAVVYPREVAGAELRYPA